MEALRINERNSSSFIEMETMTDGDVLIECHELGDRVFVGISKAQAVELANWLLEAVKE